MDDVLSFGEFPSAALGGGLDKATGKVKKAVLVRIWYNPLGDASTGGTQCTKWVANGACEGQQPVGPDGRVRVAVLMSQGSTANATRLAPQEPIPGPLLTP